MTPGIPPGIITASYFSSDTLGRLLSGVITTPRLHVLGEASGTPAIVTAIYENQQISSFEGKSKNNFINHSSTCLGSS